MPLTASAIVRPVVPAALMRRYGAQVERGLATADAIIAGRDEKALSQRTALLAFSIRIVSAFIAYVSQVLMARWLGAAEFGVFVWVWVIAVIAGGLSCLGFASALVRFIPQYRQVRDFAAMRGMTFAGRAAAMATATLVATLGMAATLVFASDSNALYTVPLIIGLTALPVLALAETQDGLSRAFDWVDMALAPTFLVRPCLILASMATALALGFEASAQLALICAVGATWAVSMVQMLIVNARIDRAVPSATRDVRLPFWLKISLPIFLVEGFFFLLTNVDILIAGAFLPPEKVAVYYAAVKTLALVHFVYFAVKAGAAHRYSQYHNGDDRTLYESFVRDTVRWTFWGSLAMGLVMVATGKVLLGLFGPAFAEGYPLLCILAVGIVIRAAVGPAESVLTMSGQQNVCALVYGTTLAINIALNVTLIPIYGLVGAAVATTIALSFEATALYAVTLRRLGLKMFIFSAPPTPRSPTPKAA